MVREAGGPVGSSTKMPTLFGGGTKMPRVNVRPENVDVDFLGLYGPQRLYLPIISPDTPNTIWYWVNLGRVDQNAPVGGSRSSIR